MIDDGHGKAHGKFTLPSLQGQMLRRLLEGFANPRIPHPIPRTTPPTADGADGVDGADGADGAEGAAGAAAPTALGMGRRRPTAEVMGEALLRLVETYPIDRVPTSGGLNATVVVTMTVETLQGGPTPATLPGTGIDLSGATARRLACTAGVIPALLDTESRILDMGRRSRLATPAQRLALLVQQDGICALDDCDRPAHWGEAHHWKKPWAQGGTTNLDDLILICPRHHTIAHLPGRSIQPTPNGGFHIHHQT